MRTVFRILLIVAVVGLNVAGGLAGAAFLGVMVLFDDTGVPLGQLVTIWLGDIAVPAIGLAIVDVVAIFILRLTYGRPRIGG